MESSGTKGRSRLKGVLNDLVQQSKDEKEGESLMVVDEDVEEAARDLLELNDDSGGFIVPRKRTRSTRSPTRRKCRKRVCKEVLSQAPDDSDLSGSEESHIPHVMTLFDRRVDLARFLPDTPLYVMCREWMWNCPHQLPTSSSSGTTTATTTTTTTQDGQLGKPLPPPSQTDVLLAPPDPLSRDAKGEPIRLDIPKPHRPHTKNQQELDEILNKHSGLNPDPLQLKLAHLARWKVIRDSWRQCSLLNQTRYSQSFTTIRELFLR